jgi:hypothetical protein
MAMRRSRDPVLALQARLTDRDNTLLGWLYDHQLLTTPQIAHALFPSLDFAQKRLLKLLHAELIDRFRPLRYGGGSYPWHYLLTYLGMEHVAAARGEERPRREAATARRRRLINSRLIDHLLGVNQFFVDLTGDARLHGGELQTWLSAQQCTQPDAFGVLAISRIRPDGHGVWSEAGVRVPFYLEWDSGTEPLTVLVGKLDSYRRQIRDQLPRWPVLLSLHSATRERNLHHRLAESGSSTVVATISRDQLATHQLSPADQVWRVHGTGTIGRLRLAELADVADDPPPDVLRQRRERRRPRHLSTYG